MSISTSNHTESHHPQFPYLSATLFMTTCLLTLVLKRRSQPPSSASNLSRFGPWAIITGGTDGIGKEFATQLAASGVNLVLISRCPQKLSQLSFHLSSQFGVSVRTIPADFSVGMETYTRIQEGLEGLEVGSLINNVGSTYPVPCFIHELETHSAVAMVNTNILSNIMMTRIVLPGMVQRRQGLILNISSLASEVSFPFLSLYAASKAFTDKFGQDIGLEYENKGVTVQTLVPACVATKMSHIQIPGYFAPSPENFVRSALGSRKRRTTGYWSHEVQMYWFRGLGLVVPELLRRWNYHVMSRWALVSRRVKDNEVRRG